MKTSHRPITNRQQDAILPHMRLSSQYEAFDRAAGFQPACPEPDEFLGLPVAIPAGPEAKETLRSPVLGYASRLKGGCRHDWLPHCAT